jgi:hypothetical protein
MCFPLRSSARSAALAKSSPSSPSPAKSTAVLAAAFGHLLQDPSLIQASAMVSFSSMAMIMRSDIELRLT